MHNASNRTPRVGIDLHVVDGIYQGSRSHCLELFSRVIAACPDIEFVLFLAEPEQLGEYSSAFFEKHVMLARMPHKSQPIRLLAQLPKLAKEYKLDLLHTQYIAPPLCPCASAVTIHDVLFESHPQFFGKFFVFRSRLLMRLSASRASMLFTVSEFSRREIIERYNVRPEHITTIHNGANITTFRPGNDGEHEIRKLGLERGEYLLTVGRLEPRKNHIALLKAYASLERPRPKLVFVGQRDFGFNPVLELIKTLGLNREVLLLENIPDELLPAIYRNAMLFAYPSWAEGFGMPVLEAMASGVPVITSNTTALPEVAANTAIYIEPDSPETLANALRALIASPQLRKNMSEQALLLAHTMDWTESTRRVVARYRQFFDLPPLSSRA